MLKKLSSFWKTKSTGPGDRHLSSRSQGFLPGAELALGSEPSLPLLYVLTASTVDLYVWMDGKGLGARLGQSCWILQSACEGHVLIAPDTDSKPAMRKPAVLCARWARRDES